MSDQLTPAMTAKQKQTLKSIQRIEDLFPIPKFNAAQLRNSLLPKPTGKFLLFDLIQLFQFLELA